MCCGFVKTISEALSQRKGVVFIQRVHWLFIFFKQKLLIYIVKTWIICFIFCPLLKPNFYFASTTTGPMIHLILAPTKSIKALKIVTSFK